jgi:hypothetical protein
MKTKILLAFIVMSFLWGCTSTMKYTWTKVDYEGRKFNKILVVVMSATVQGRTIAENTMVDMFAKKGITATNSLTVFPPDENALELSEDEIQERILSGNYDGVLITKLIDASAREVREGGGSYYQPVTYRYRRSIRTGYMYMQEPEYYRQEESYVVESQLFDVAEEATRESVVWSGQSTLTDPSSFESAAETYSKTLVKTLLKSGKIVVN